MGTNDLLTLNRDDLVIDLYSWINGAMEHGHEALKGITGFGLPPVTNRFFEGAGDGAVFRGSKILPRVLMIPLISQSSSRAGLDGLLSQLARVFTPNGSTQARLRYMASDGLVWYLDVVREDGGDYIREPKEFQRNRFYKTTLGLKAGDPYWTREMPDGFTLKQDSSGRGLMPYLAKLEVSSGKVFGRVTPENVGDAPTWPIWTVGGPLSSLTLTGPYGEVLAWTGSISSSQRRIIDTKNGTIVDENGVNKYNELGTAPQFWPIPADELAIQIDTTGTSTATFITAQWQPRKWSMI